MDAADQWQLWVADLQLQKQQAIQAAAAAVAEAPAAEAPAAEFCQLL